MSDPQYHKIALNNARIIEVFSNVLDSRNKLIKKLLKDIHELTKQQHF